MDKFTPERIKLLRAAYGQQATDLEFEIFINHCRRLDLSPEAAQVFLIGRWDDEAKRKVHRILVSLQGLRTVAERTGKVRGMVGPMWIGRGMKDFADYWISPEPPLGAKVGIIKQGCAEPFWGFCRWDSFKQTKRGGQLSSNWKRMPEHMLAKCANAIALRAAFPDLLAGLYTDDEFGEDHASEANQSESVTVITRPDLTVVPEPMAQVGPEGAAAPQESEPEYVPMSRVQDMLDAFSEIGWDRLEIEDLLKGCPLDKITPDTFRWAGDVFTKLSLGTTSKEDLLGYVPQDVTQ